MRQTEDRLSEQGANDGDILKNLPGDSSKGVSEHIRTVEGIIKR
jgi:hypothetical protein